MRPILLELDGFCSYRTKARIDFREANFFVLVGPTGSGKSTVIDAMVFALYGTVPRWGERNAVAPALAPTVNRGVVRLIFDAGGKRYVAARDIRRVGRGNPSVREARIEKLLSANATGEPDEETTVLATGRAVNATVEEILGLTFDQFTQSVALPQGEFARFLHATDAQRQDILKNLLGYNIYESIQSAAYSRASHAESRASTLAQQLENYADATDERVQAFSLRLNELQNFRSHVATVAVPALKQATAEANAARDQASQAASERERLTRVTKPPGVDELQTALAQRENIVRSAQAHQDAIELRDSEIREQLKTATPRRQLEQILDNWQELANIEARLPTLTEQESLARTDHETAQQKHVAADQAVRAARDAATQAGKTAEERRNQLQTATDHLSKVQALATPNDIQAIAHALARANDVVAAANSDLAISETTQRTANEALDRLPDSAVLANAAGDVERIVAAIALDTEQSDDREAALAAMTEAQRSLDTAQQKVTACEQTLRAAEHANQAAALRAELQVGDDCPVCGATITELVGDEGPADLRSARDALKSAKAAAEKARTDSARLQSRHQQLLAVRSDRLHHCDAVRSQLLKLISVLGITNPPAALAEQLGTHASTEQLTALRDAATSVQVEIADATSQRSAATERRRAADAAVQAAREVADTARRELSDAQARSQAALSAVQAARDSVSALGPPPFDGTDIAAAWQTITAWGETQAGTLSIEVASLTNTSEEARSASDQASVLLGEADVAVSAAIKAVSDAALARQRAAAALDNARQRRSELLAALEGATSSESAAEQLEVVQGWELQLEDVGRQVTAARSATAEARDACSVAKAAVEEGWQHMRRVRDQLAGIGAPEISGLNLSAEWKVLLDWAETEARTRAAIVESQRDLLAEAEARSGSAADALRNGLAAHALHVAEDLSAAELADQAPVLVSAAVATAQAQLDRAEERKRESEDMQTEMAAARDSAEVARELSRQMRANNFPRWLIAGALDTLLQDASAILLDLSGGQFELTRDEGDLLVIDHNDADMTRPVKTLSGGETFQASLALALALSEQVTSLSAAGASRLESIFLDEGFGTLDETTLDVVASTLDTLASTGSRMVGVITHVAALAERIPVRFQVNRDTAGSHIERVAV